MDCPLEYGDVTLFWNHNANNKKTLSASPVTAVGWAGQRTHCPERKSTGWIQSCWLFIQSVAFRGFIQYFIIYFENTRKTILCKDRDLFWLVWAAFRYQGCECQPYVSQLIPLSWIGKHPFLHVVSWRWCNWGGGKEKGCHFTNDTVTVILLSPLISLNIWQSRKVQLSKVKKLQY